MKRLALILGLAAAVMPASAEWTNDIDFETNKGYKSISMYDCWENSPFRTGALRLIPQVVTNPDQAVNEILQVAPNDSEKAAGAQRSRFGSNRYGLRVDLSEDNYFELTPTIKYVHVKLLKPVSGRVMLVGLGSRDDVPDQDPYVEQFWEVSQNGCQPGKWNDMVFAIKGAGGITMRSFVLVPDLESPHNYSSDFLFYVDDIKINEASAPEIKYEYYRTSNDKATAKLDRNDRYTTSVQLVSPKYGTQAVAVNQQADKLAYQNYLANMPIVVEAGESIKPSMAGAINWMHCYFFLDLDNNGKFDVDTENATGEIMSYSYYKGKDSANKSYSGANTQVMPEFKIPEDLTPGLYRGRFKLDWDDITPEGRPGAAGVQNSLIDNGGVVVDVMLNVVKPGGKASVNDFQLNGEILAADGAKLTNYEVPAMEDFEVLVAPEKGFENNGFTLKFGYGAIDTEGEENRFDKYGNPQWFVVDFPLNGFAKDDNYKMIPGKYVFGNLLLQGRMAEVGTREPYYNVNFDKAEAITRTDRHLDKVTITPAGGTAQEISLADNVNPRLVYVEKLETPIKVSAGKKVSVDISYTGRAMHHYLYVDYDDNGYFNYSLGSDNLPASGSEVVSFSYYQGKNSTGESFSKAGDVSVTSTPDFTIPANIPDGYYRARLKTDWNNINPGAREPELTDNKIWENGGAILDFILQVGEPVFAESVTLSENNLKLNAGEIVNLKATVAPDNTSNPTIRWSSSNRSVATVNTSGEVKAVGGGEAVITASCGEAKAECAVAVTEVYAESISVSSGELSLNAGESATLTVTILPENTYNKNVKWSTSNSSVAVVNNGVITAVGGGEAVITATCGDVTTECTVSVSEVYAESVTLSEEKVSLILGKSVTLTATVTPENTYNKTATWTTSNDKVATVNSQGVVSTVGAGTAVITATFKGGAHAECEVTVTEVLAETIELSKTELSLVEGDYEVLGATVKPVDAYNKSITWASSDEEVATVDVNGVVSAVAEGTATITATCGDAHAECTVTVTAPNVVVAESVTLSASAMTIEVGKSDMLTAKVLPENTTDKTVVWTSSNEDVATVSAAGSVYAVGEGTATITATCGDISAVCEVTVVAPAPIEAESITLSESTLSIEVGATKTLTATVLPEDAVDKTVEWASSNATVATVSPEGLVTAVAEGNAVITATCGALSADCAVTVTAASGEDDSIEEILAGESDSKAYDVLGRRVIHPAKGSIVIVNGKCVKL